MNECLSHGVILMTNHCQNIYKIEYWLYPLCGCLTVIKKREHTHAVEKEARKIGHNMHLLNIFRFMSDIRKNLIVQNQEFMAVWYYKFTGFFIFFKLN